MIRARNRVNRPGGAPSGQIESFSFFDTVAADAARGSVTLEKKVLNQTLTQTWTLSDYGVSALLSMDVAGVLELEELTNNVYFIPEQRSDRQVEPLDFAWLPNLHRHADHVCGDHFFRAPAAVAAFEGYYAALVPDLDLLRDHRGDLPFALDLRIIETEVEAPRLSYGICPWTVDGHVYTAHRPGMTCVLRGTRVRFGFDLLFGVGDRAPRGTGHRGRLPVAALRPPLPAGPTPAGAAVRGIRSPLHLRARDAGGARTGDHRRRALRGTPQRRPPRRQLPRLGERPARRLRHPPLRPGVGTRRPGGGRGGHHQPVQPLAAQAGRVSLRLQLRGRLLGRDAVLDRARRGLIHLLRQRGDGGLRLVVAAAPRAAGRNPSYPGERHRLRTLPGRGTAPERRHTDLVLARPESGQAAPGERHHLHQRRRARPAGVAA